MKAKHPGTCPRCRRRFPAGTPIFRQASGHWGHFTCKPSPETIERQRLAAEAEHDDAEVSRALRAWKTDNLHRVAIGLRRLSWEDWSTQQPSTH